MEGIFVPLGLFLMVAVIVAASVWGSVQNKRTAADVIKRAIESGQQLDPESISALHKPARAAAQDIRGGIVLTALALGFVAAGAIYYYGGPGDGDGIFGFLIAACIIGAIGIGQLIAGFMRQPKKEG